MCRHGEGSLVPLVTMTLLLWPWLLPLWPQLLSVKRGCPGSQPSAQRPWEIALWYRTTACVSFLLYGGDRGALSPACHLMCAQARQSREKLARWSLPDNICGSVILKNCLIHSRLKLVPGCLKTYPGGFQTSVLLAIS